MAKGWGVGATTLSLRLLGPLFPISGLFAPTCFQGPGKRCFLGAVSSGKDGEETKQLPLLRRWTQEVDRVQ